MEKEQRLTPLPSLGVELQTVNQDYPSAYAPFYDEDNFEEKRSLRYYFTIIYKRLPLILALTILTTAVAAFYMYRQPLQYQAQTEMIIEARKQKGQAGGPININFGNDVNYNNTQLQLLQNPDLMKGVVVDLGLQRQPNLFNNQSKGAIDTMRSIFSRDKSADNQNTSLPVLTASTETAEDNLQVALTPEEKARVDNYSGVFLGGLKVEQVPQTNLVHISVQSTNPDLAAKVADRVAQAFIDQNVKLETQGAKQTYEELTKSIEDLKGTIGVQERELIGFTQNNDLPLGDSGKGGDLSATILQQTSSQWLTAMNDRRKLEQSYTAAVRAAGEGRGMNVPEINDDKITVEKLSQNTSRQAKLQDTIREYESRIKNAETEKAQLLVRYTEENPKVQQKTAEIVKLQENLETIKKDVTAVIERDKKKIESDAVSGVLTNLRAQLNSAINRENQLRASYENEASKAQRSGEAETRLTTLKRAIETNRSLLDKYTQSQKEQELLIAGSRPDNLKISNHAVTPGAPIGPQRTRNIFIAFLISLAAGIGLAFLMDYLDDSVKSSDDIGRNLGLPTLALIPHQNLIDKRKLTDLALSRSGGQNGSMTLITMQDQRSPMAEAYRHLRTSLLFSSAGKPPQTILITSSQPSEGKTTTAINTAITLAQGDADVVIIDCDLRRPRLHSHFGMDNTHGLTNYLSGEKNPENMIKTFADLPRLKVITSGPIPPNPAELLSSNEMKNLLQFLKGKYKHIIVDSPPAISFTDAAILSTQVDGVVLVAMAGKSSLHLMRRFKQRLGTIGARIYGVVLNGIKANSMEYDYGTSYVYYAAPSDDTTPMMEDVAAIHDTKD